MTLSATATIDVTITIDSAVAIAVAVFRLRPGAVEGGRFLLQPQPCSCWRCENEFFASALHGQLLPDGPSCGTH